MLFLINLISFICCIGEIKTLKSVINVLINKIKFKKKLQKYSA